MKRLKQCSQRTLDTSELDVARDNTGLADRVVGEMFTENTLTPLNLWTHGETGLDAQRRWYRGCMVVARKQCAELGENQ